METDDYYTSYLYIKNNMKQPMLGMEKKNGSLEDFIRDIEDRLDEYKFSYYRHLDWTAAAPSDWFKDKPYFDMEERFTYGMKPLDFVPGKTMLDGLVCFRKTVSDDLKERGYHYILVYDRPLTEQELTDCELDDLNSTGKTRLQQRRKKKGFTVRELSEKTGIKDRQIEYLDQKAGRMNRAAAETAIKIADALGCDVRKLMD